MSAYFHSLQIISDVNMTITRPHAMFSEERLARVTGGKWFLKTETFPRPDFLRAGNMLIGHPATLATLRALEARDGSSRSQPLANGSLPVLTDTQHSDGKD